MSIISAFQPFTSIHGQNNPQIVHKPHPSSRVHCPKNAISTQKFPLLKVTQMSKLRKVRSVEEETQFSEPAVGAEEAEAPAEKPSPSDKLIMLFLADGTMSDSAAPAVRQALEVNLLFEEQKLACEPHGLPLQIMDHLCSLINVDADFPGQSPISWLYILDRRSTIR